MGKISQEGLFIVFDDDRSGVIFFYTMFILFSL